jgi:hypothetical protein
VNPPTPFSLGRLAKKRNLDPALHAMREDLVAARRRPFALRMACMVEPNRVGRPPMRLSTQPKIRRLIITTAPALMPCEP